MARLKTCYTLRCNGVLLLKFTMDLGWGVQPTLARWQRLLHCRRISSEVNAS
jgi:hypothetical protein